MPNRPVRGRIASSPDTDTLYPKHIDSGAARVVTLCFGFCSALCFVLFYLVLALAIIPEMGPGDWQRVKCRAKEATVASEPSRVCRGKGDVNCDVETDPEVPTPGGLWEERCHDTHSLTSPEGDTAREAEEREGGACVSHIWANVLLEWEQPEDDHRKVNLHVDRMAEGVHETVGRMIHKDPAAARTQKYLSVCYAYRCGGSQRAMLERRAVAEAQALRFVQSLRNESGLPSGTELAVSLSVPLSVDAAGNASAAKSPFVAERDPQGDRENAKVPLPVPPKEQLHREAEKDAEGQPTGGSEAGLGGGQSGVVKAPEQLRSGRGPGDLWMARECSYSRTFYATVPGISPLRRGASAAVYFKTPTGYVDLPGGVTVWSVLTLTLFGGCTVGQLCCLYSQCKAYGYGGLFDPKHAKSRSVGHLL
jgi:hypothetical protein